MWILTTYETNIVLGTSSAMALSGQIHHKNVGKWHPFVAFRGNLVDSRTITWQRISIENVAGESSTSSTNTKQTNYTWRTPCNVYQLRYECSFGIREGGRPGGHKRALRWGVEESEEGGQSG